MNGSRFSIEYGENGIVLRYYFIFTDTTVQRLKLTNPAVSEVIGEWWEPDDTSGKSVERCVSLRLDYHDDVTVYTHNVDKLFEKILHDNMHYLELTMVPIFRVIWASRTDYEHYSFT